MAGQKKISMPLRTVHIAMGGPGQPDPELIRKALSSRASVKFTAPRAAGKKGKRKGPTEPK